MDPSIEVTDEESEGDEVEETSGEKTDEKAESPGEKNSETPAKPSKRARLRRKLKGKSGTRDNEPNGDTSATGGSGANAQPASRSVSGQGTASAAKKAPHRATTCPCDKEKKHFQTVVMDTTFPAVPEKMYNLMFTSGFMKEFWTGNQKLLGECARLLCAHSGLPLTIRRFDYVQICKCQTGHPTRPTTTCSPVPCPTSSLSRGGSDPNKRNVC